MKNFLMFLILATIWLGSNGQGHDNPILPRIYENGYSVQQIQSFAEASTLYSKNYRIKLLSVINDGLRKSGEYINVNGGKPLDEEWIDWIYAHVVRNPYVHLDAGYSNTWQNGNLVSDYEGKEDYNGPVDQFIFGSCVINLDKPSCVNILGDLANSQSSFIIPPQVQVDFANQKSTTSSSTSSVATQGFETESISFVAPKTIKEMMTTSIPNDYEEPFVPVVTKKNKKWLWVAIPVASVVAATIIYLVANQNKHSSPIIGAPAWVPMHRDGR